MARVLVVPRMIGVRSVLLTRARRWDVRCSGVTVGALSTTYGMRGMGVGRCVRPVVSVPVMMRVRVCHSDHRTPNVSVAHFDS
jgi:hypothetical protein